MKKTLLSGLALGLVLAASTSYAGSVVQANLPAQGCAGGAEWNCSAQDNFGGAGIIGSSHDMTNVALELGLIGSLATGQTGAADLVNAVENNATSLDEQKRICVYCHHPHNAVSATDDSDTSATGVQTLTTYSPLWNRRANASTAYQGYNNGVMMNDSSTDASDKRHVLNANVEGGGTSITGVSLLCMSCHDGVTAMSAYSQANDSGKTGSTENSGKDLAVNNIKTAYTSSFEGDMNNHHPMGFKYNLVQAVDAEIADSSTMMVPAGNIDIQGLLYGVGDDATMECVTCHDVHNTANAAGAERFLWRSDNYSNFCLTCHLK